MSDNAKCYTRPPLRSNLRPSRCPPHPHPALHTPLERKRIERFFGTLETEWAHGQIWPNSHQRDQALSSFLRYYNRWRPHSAANGRPPNTRVHQDRKQDT